MTDEVIPEIVRAVEERRKLAAESRNWQLEDLNGLIVRLSHTFIGS